MTDEQIVKALECCMENNLEACNECPLKRGKGDMAECLAQKEKLAFNLISRQREEIASLKQIIDEKLPQGEQK